MAARPLRRLRRMIEKVRVWLGHGTRSWQLGLVAIALFQAAQAVVAIDWEDIEYYDSYWLWSYDDGFIRRGLAGEILQLLSGGSLDRDVAVVLYTTIAVVASVAVFAVLWRAASSRQAGVRLLAIIVAASPFCFDFLLYQRRPDQLSFLVFVAVAVGLTRTTFDRRFVIAAGAVGLAVTLFIHEGGLLVTLPWLLVVVFLTGAQLGESPRRMVGLGCLAALLPLATFALLSLQRPSASTQEAVLTAYEAAGIPDDRGMAIYIDDGIGETLRDVAEQVPSLLPGTVLVLVVVVSILVLVTPRIELSLDRRAVIGLGIALVLSFSSLSAAGIDWLRWASWYGLSAGVVVLLLGDRGSERGASPDHVIAVPEPATSILPWYAAGAGIAYLAMLVPMPAVVTLREGVRMLLGFTPVM